MNQLCDHISALLEVGLESQVTKRLLVQVQNLYFLSSSQSDWEKFALSFKYKKINPLDMYFYRLV